jgi:hypothetical protein
LEPTVETRTRVVSYNIGAYTIFLSCFKLNDLRFNNLKILKLQVESIGVVIIAVDS